MSAFLTSCDICGFECDAVYVDSAWSFVCDLCRAVSDAELGARIPETSTVTVTMARNAKTDIVACDMMTRDALARIDEIKARGKVLADSITRNISAMEGI